MLSTVLSGLWARKRRLVGTTTAVVLGVAFLAATLVLGDTMRSGFSAAFTEANAGTDVIVRSSSVMGDEPRIRDLIDEDVAEQVAAFDGVAAAFPTIEGVGTILDGDGNRIGGDGPPTKAANWIDDPAVNPYRIVEGRAPVDGTGDREPYEVVIDRRSANEGDLGVGDRTRVLTPTPVDVTVVGIATFGDVDSLGPITYTGFTFDAARELLASRSDGLSSVLVVAEDGVDQESLRDQLAAQLPARAEALTGAELTAEQNAEIESDFVGMFRTILLAFAGVALVVATFSIHNTFSILVAQRTRESALLRAIGASRRQVITAVTGEALAVGVLASALGIGAGIGLASGLKALLAGAGIDLSMTGLVVTGGAVAVAAAVGVIVTLVATVAPAIAASRVPPLAALRDVAIDRSGSSWVRAIAGALVAGAGVAVIITATASDDGAMGRAALGSLALIVGAVVLGPVVARPAAAVLGAGPSLTRGFAGRLARRNAMRNPRRIAGSASALMVGTGVVAVFTTFGASIKASIDEEVDRSFSGDLVILQDGFSGAGMDQGLAAAIAELPEVADSVGVGFGTVQVNGVDESPTVTDPARLDAAMDLGVEQGSIDTLAPGELAVSTHYAEDHELALGDTVPMSFLDGTTSDFTVGAVFAERMSFGDLVMHRADWAPHAVQDGDTVVLVDLVDGVDVTAAQAAVNDVTARFDAPRAETRDEYIDSIGAEIDAMLGLVYGMLGVAVLIALIGIGNTLSLSIHERTRELGLLRAVGQDRRQLRSTVRWESVIVAVFGTLGGIGFGSFMGWGLMRAMAAEEGFGTFALPTTSLAIVVALAALAGVLAAVRPARRAARLDVLSAITTT